MVASLATVDELQESITGRTLVAGVRTVATRPEELLVAQVPTWLPNVVTKLAALLDLQSNWDSHGARPISMTTARNALELLLRLRDLCLPSPNVVPTAQGGIQFEWSRAGLELELELEPRGTMVALFDDSDRAESWERELYPGDLGPITNALRRIADAGRRG
jgi:hypothetical protein